MGYLPYGVDSKALHIAPAEVAFPGVAWMWPAADLTGPQCLGGQRIEYHYMTEKVFRTLV